MDLGHGLTSLLEISPRTVRTVPLFSLPHLIIREFRILCIPVLSLMWAFKKILPSPPPAFSFIPSPLAFSFIPSPSLTHWRQALLMLNTPLMVDKGDYVEGRITITRNKVWRRHLKVHLRYRHTGVGFCTGVRPAPPQWCHHDVMHFASYFRRLRRNSCCGDDSFSTALPCPLPPAPCLPLFCCCSHHTQIYSLCNIFY